MKITIHRGANQIGGCITEITTGNAKVFIDFGSNLPGSQQKELTAVEVERMTSDADAIFYSHYHGAMLGCTTLFQIMLPNRWVQEPLM